MIPLELTAAEQRAFHRALTRPHRDVRLRVDFLTLEHQVASSATRAVVEAEMALERGDDRTVDRVLTLKLWDPQHRLGLSSASPSQVQVTADRMVRAIWSLWVPELDRFVDVPVFTGPVTKVEADDGLLSVEAQGKERLAVFARGRTRTVAKGLTVLGAFRVVMREWIGEDERHLTRVPRWTHMRLAEPLVLGVKSEGWIYARHLAKLAGGHVFYDGRGDVVVRKLPRRPAWRFSHMDVVAYPGATVDALQIVNKVVVHGAKVQGKPPVVGQAHLPVTHPHSAHSLGRRVDGDMVPRYLEGDPVQDDSVRTESAADALAQRILDDANRIDAQVEFESLVIPHLEPGDLCSVPQSVGGSDLSFRLWTLRMGLLHDGVMTVGHTRRARLRRGRR
ncbi:hypothetical protein [Janibacter anophelis]|uniref:hypothetical protein n=1 Tax=Janibacter anophelis TaxID=319054 RepID=UPI000DEFCDD1|nr:hypothetical protein [Janibacter anophelis]